MKFKQWLEDYFHGSPNLINKFDYLFIGKGYDQEGPGFYFTNNEEDARRYGKKIYRVKLNLNKTVPLRGRVSRREVEELIKRAPDLENILTDWDENPVIALRKAIDSVVLHSQNSHDAFQQVWYDFYHRSGHDAEYLKNMTTLGYDGVIIPKGEGVKHVVVFDPSKIEII